MEPWFRAGEIILLKLWQHINVRVLAPSATRRDKGNLGLRCFELLEPDLRCRPIGILPAGTNNHLSLSDWGIEHTWDDEIQADRQQRPPHVKIWSVDSKHRCG